MSEGISLLGGQILIPAYISLPLPVVILGAVLALVGAITLFCLYIASQPTW
jgi:hypothetical protein